MHLQPLSALLLFLSAAAPGASIYVDQDLASNCDTYDVATRSCGSGSERAFLQFNDAQHASHAGDTVFLRAGRYGQLNVEVSGAPGNPITIRAYLDESVTISDPRSIGLRIINQQHLLIADMVVERVIGFGRLENATAITVDNIDFRVAGASGTTGSLKLVLSSHNRVMNSSFDDGSDLLLLQDDSNFNVLQGNRFGRASHSLISIRCSSQNVIRDNEFNNTKQKAVEIYDCEGVSDAPVRLDDTRRNLLERNRFLGTAAASRDYYFNAIQHGGQQNIVRMNIFTGNRGGGVNYQYYARESLFVYGNRLYNNTFYRNACFAVIGQDGQRSRFQDNRVLNNLLYDNRDCSGRHGQTRIKNRRSVIVLAHGEADKAPGFVDASGRDFRLAVSSPWIDAGEFATRTASSGGGLELTVEDASWFYDGFGIAGESGDIVRIEGKSETARVLEIDYANNTLLLESQLDWQRGDGVHTLYIGDAPDMGAFESRPLVASPSEHDRRKNSEQ